MRDRLEKFQRARLALLPTPIEPLKRLSEHLGGPLIWVKRDDCTGLAFGGNKARKLEYVLGNALHEGIDTVVTFGAVQSNHARMTAAAAAKLGMRCILMLLRPTQAESTNYYQSGNIYLDRLLGAEVQIVGELPASSAKGNINQIFDEARSQLELRLAKEGRKPIFIPVGASTPLGNLGYANAVSEIALFSDQTSVEFDEIVCVSGSGGTQAGLIVGVQIYGLKARVRGIRCTNAERIGQLAQVRSLVEGTNHLLDIDEASSEIEVIVDEFEPAMEAERGYAAINKETREALRLVAQLEGLVLDPVYTGPAMAGLIQGIRSGRFRVMNNILFVHTGGLPGMFGYIDRMQNLLS